MAKAIAKTETKELESLSEKDRGRLVNPEVSGMDEEMEQPRIDYPCRLSVLQNSNQSKWFPKGEFDLERDGGKLFFNKGEESTMIEDFMDSIEGTILKMEWGTCIYENEEEQEDNNVLSRQPGTIGTKDQEQWLYDNRPKQFQNRVRVTISLLSAEETLKALKTRQLGDEDVEMPLVSVELKGSSYGVGYDIRGYMDAILRESAQYDSLSSKDRRSILKSLFRVKFWTEKEINEKKRVFYPYHAEVSLNSISEALAFEPLLIELDEFPFFGAKVKSVEVEAEVVDPKYAKNRETLKKIKTREVSSEEKKEEITPAEVEKQAKNALQSKDALDGDLPF